MTSPLARRKRRSTQSDAPDARGAVVEHTVAQDAEIGEGARVGPYAVLPPGSLVPAWTVTGAFYTGPT